MKGRKGAGFTLIELLVVIAIIAILAAILFPIFITARESSRRTKCMANFKNINTALQMFRDDHNGKNAHIWHGPGGATFDHDSFFWVIANYIGQRLSSTPTGSENQSRHNVYRCPSAPWLKQEFQSGFHKRKDDGFKYSGFAYTMNETGWRPKNGAPAKFMGGGIHDSEVKRPSQIIFVTEGMGWTGFGVAYGDGSLIDNENPSGGPTSGDGWWSNHPAPEEDIPLSTPGYLGPHHGSKSKIYNMRVSHSMGANVMFYDGHVKWMKTTKGKNWAVIY